MCSDAFGALRYGGPPPPRHPPDERFDTRSPAQGQRAFLGAETVRLSQEALPKAHLPRVAL